jgi:hypothetical protein
MSANKNIDMSELDNIEKQIAELQNRKNELLQQDIDKELNNYCDKIIKAELSDIKKSLENKIKNDIYNDCIEDQFGYWKKIPKMEYCGNQAMPGDKLDYDLPGEFVNKLLDKSIIENYKDYEVKLYVRHSRNRCVNVDTYDFIVNDGMIDDYLLLFRKKNEETNKFCYATYIYTFPTKYSYEWDRRRILLNQKEILKMQKEPIVFPEPDLINPLYIHYNLIHKSLNM